MRADVVVVGLGSAGAAVAAACARKGLSVFACDARPVERAGAYWVNGVPLHAFRRSGLPLPPAAVRGAALPFHFKAGRSGPKLCVRDHDLLEIDMAVLIEALCDDARTHGATLVHQAPADHITAAGIRVGGEHIHGDVTVLATGLTDHYGPPAQEDLCVAAQQTLAVTDLAAARAFFHQHGVHPGETLCFSGIAGGYSIINVRLDGEHLELLTGSLPKRGFPSGLAIATSFRKEHPWIGAMLAGGSRALPLGLPAARLDAGGVFRVGDAAGLVHAAHGSGVAQQLLLAGQVADGLAAGHRPYRINRHWQRTHGGLLAAADVFRRFSCTLTTEQVGLLIERGVLSESLFAAGLLQHSPAPSLRELLRAVRGLSQAPALAKRLVPVLLRMQALELWATRYPSRPEQVERWSRRREQLAG